jgi:hypothetical protein
MLRSLLVLGVLGGVWLEVGCTRKAELFDPYGHADATAPDGATAEASGAEVQAAAPDVAADDAAADATASPGDGDGEDGAADVGPPALLVVDRNEATFTGAADPFCPRQSSSFVVTNSGGRPSGIIATLLTGIDFKIAADGCAGTILAPAARCTVEVQFAAVTAGMKNGALTISATPGGSMEVKLVGSALSVDGLWVSPNSTMFPDTPLGQTSAGVTFTLRNAGSGDFSMVMASVSTSDFVITDDRCSGPTLAANTSCEVKVAFRPQSPGARSALLTQVATGCGAGAAQATLTGTGVP